jgi:superfamily II RNA helicase
MIQKAGSLLLLQLLSLSCHLLQHQVHAFNLPQQSKINNLQRSRNVQQSSSILFQSKSTKKDSFDAVDDMVEQAGRAELQQYFDFPIDSWQARSGGEILAGNNVIVCAPTGAGKTVVGEMALHHAFHSDPDGAAIYTTPLKALSNQKYAELRKIFGANNVGLATGDMSINRGARIMVMTTEVYRNMAWRAMDDADEEDRDDRMDDDLSQRGRNELSNIKVVVLDEFHYMGQKGRGGVWEECVITSPRHTQIIGLSATLPNADRLGMWMEKVTERKTTLVEATGGRPVPLRFLFATRDGVEPLFRNPDAGPGSPLGLLGLRGDGIPETKFRNKSKNAEEEFDKNVIPKGLDLNPKLKSMLNKRSEAVNRMVAKKALRLKDEKVRRDEYGGDGGRKRRDSGLNPREQKRERDRLLKTEMRKSVPSLSFLLRKLEQKSLLPAIFFLFSRAGCDEAAENVCFQMKKGAEIVKRANRGDDNYEGSPKQGRQRSVRKTEALLKDKSGRSFRSNSNYVTEDTMSNILEGPNFKVDTEISNPLEESNFLGYAERGLLTYEQVKDVAARVKSFNRQNEEIKFSDETIDRLLHGVGSHHAGQLPAHKAVAEALFRAQLMKVVFATETLAAGINMPARTTVICSLAKRGDGGTMNALETANTLQMAGRAGRRGMDTDGTCVLVTTPFEGPEEAIDIIVSEIKPVESQFSPGYSLAVNLIARGEGKLDVAQKLVQKSFAQWNRQQVESQVETAKQLHGEDFESMIETAAHEQFLDSFKSSLDKGRHMRMFEVLDDKALLKKASKSFAGLYQILNLEESTLSYLQKELDVTTNIDSAMDEDGLSDLLSEDNINIEEEMTRQRKRIQDAREDVSNHIMTALAVEANTVLRSSLSIVPDMKAALAVSRKNNSDVNQDDNMTPFELTAYAKSSVTLNRKKRKQKNAAKDSGFDESSIIGVLNAAEEEDDSLEDLMALINVLQSYGCITPSDDSKRNPAHISYRITTAGENVGLLGLDNALWFLSAMGGAWDVVGASAELDKFKNEMNSMYDDRTLDGLFDMDNDTISAPKEKEQTINAVPLPQIEASSLTDLLRNLLPEEIAGYVSCLVADGGRRDGNTSVLAAFQNLSSAQQRVVQSSLLALERLTEVQNKFSVDEGTSKVSLELATCEVVTAWTAGCSWNEGKFNLQQHILFSDFDSISILFSN